MNIRQTTRTPAILRELGSRIERLRLQRNQTLADLAEAAGVGPATLQRLETGRNANLKTVIQVLRALNHLGDLDNIIADVEVSPFEISGARKTPRKRASKSEGKSPVAEESDG